MGAPPSWLKHHPMSPHPNIIAIGRFEFPHDFLRGDKNIQLIALTLITWLRLFLWNFSNAKLPFVINKCLVGDTLTLWCRCSFSHHNSESEESLQALLLHHCMKSGRPPSDGGTKRMDRGNRSPFSISVRIVWFLGLGIREEGWETWRKMEKKRERLTHRERHVTDPLK